MIKNITYKKEKKKTKNTSELIIIEIPLYQILEKIKEERNGGLHRGCERMARVILFYSSGGSPVSFIGSWAN